MEARQINEVSPKEIYQNLMFWMDQYKNIPGGNSEVAKSQGAILTMYNHLSDMADEFESAEFLEELNMMRERFVEFTIDAVLSAENDMDARTKLFNMFDEWGVILGCKLKPMEEL